MEENVTKTAGLQPVCVCVAFGDRRAYITLHLSIHHTVHLIITYLTIHYSTINNNENLLRQAIL